MESGEFWRSFRSAEWQRSQPLARLSLGLALLHLSLLSRPYPIMPHDVQLCN